MAFRAQYFVNFPFNEWGDKLLDGFQPLVKIQRPNQRLECAARNSGAFSAAGVLFPFAHIQKRAQFYARSKIGEHFRAHQRRAQAGKFALFYARKVVIKVFCGHKIENGIAQKFEPLIIFQRVIRVFIQVRAVR